MSPEQRWQRVQDLCEQAEALPPGRRASFLAEAESDPALRAEAETLLAALHHEEEARLAALPPLPPTAAMPESIGPYRITGLLGKGGAGAVYAAEVDRAGVPMKLAVKLLHAHLDDDEALARFRREQQILARLNHPHITRIIDAGSTPDHRPFLVMERVDGLPINQYCDQNSLSVRDRIALTIAVCRAVESAHRAFIVHLDLKPSNLLVTAGGHPKLLDFGTAKLLDPLGPHTTTRQLTPLYASPEQLRGEPVTTACDVYSLSLILYELLVGAWPFGKRTSLVAVSDRAAGNTLPSPSPSPSPRTPPAPAAPPPPPSAPPSAATSTASSPKPSNPTPPAATPPPPNSPMTSPAISTAAPSSPAPKPPSTASPSTPPATAAPFP